jgi:hypothetical protein
MMKKYMVLQWSRKILALGILGLFIYAAGYPIRKLVSKPAEGTITLTSFSQVAFDELNCDYIEATNSSFADQFPLSLSYQPGNTEEDFYMSTLRITNAEHVFVTTKTSANGEEVSNETKLISPNKTFSLKIKADRFRWKSSLESSSFDEVKNIISPGKFPDYSNVTCNIFNECAGEPKYEFDWIPENPSFIYNVGLCGENLRYLLRYESATLDNLFSLGADITPIGGGKTAWIMSFTEYPGNDSFGATRTDTTVRIILNPSPSAENDFFVNTTPSIHLLFTHLTDSSIAVRDTGTSVDPGLTIDVDYLDQLNLRNNPLSSVNKVGIKAKSINVDSPKGTIVANSPKITIPENAEQMRIYSTSSPLDFSFENSPYIHKKYEFAGKRIGASVDGEEYIPSPWEQLSPELQNAYVAATVAIAVALFSSFSQNRQVVKFFSWLFYWPRYHAPVSLPDNSYIFQLRTGKKISGIPKKIESRWINPIFVLNEVREWENDNWSDALSTEVRIPQSQIERYYKAHP